MASLHDSGVLNPVSHCSPRTSKHASYFREQWGHPLVSWLCSLSPLFLFMGGNLYLHLSSSAACFLPVEFHDCSSLLFCAPVMRLPWVCSLVSYRDYTRWSCHRKENWFAANKEIMGNNFQSCDFCAGVNGLPLIRVRKNIHNGEF